MPTIEQNLERIADALEKIAANGGVGFIANTVNTSAADTSAADTSAADKAAADKKAKADKAKADKAAADKAAADKAAEEAAAADALNDKPSSGKTKDDVRKALQAYREIEGTPAMLEVLKKAGATTLNDLAEDKYDEVIAAVS